MKKIDLKEIIVWLVTIISLVLLWSLMIYVNKSHDPFLYSIMAIYTLISFIRITIRFKNKKKNKSNELAVPEHFELNSYKQTYEIIYDKGKKMLNKIKTKNRIKSFLWILLFVLICIGLFKTKGDLFNLMIALTFISGLFIAFKISCYYSDLEEVYTKEIVNIFIKETNTNYTYENDPSLEINKLIEKEYINADFDEYLDAGYWGQKFLERYSVKDYIISDVNNIEVKCVHLRDISLGTSANNRHARFIREAYPETRPFNGTFIIIQKSYNCDIKIHSTNKIHRKNALINIDNEEFDKYFKISSKNKEDVKNYLTTDLIKFILEFRKKYNIDFEIVFKDKVYVRFYTEEIFARLNDKSIYKFYVINQFMKEFVEILDDIN